MGLLDTDQPIVRLLRTVVLTQTYIVPISFLLLLFDGVLSTWVIRKINYTEIDWRAYMQQIALYRKGERVYTKIYGDTGPLVYGAGHVYIYDLLYRFTDGGRDLEKGQWAFAAVYLVALGIVLACYAKAKVPPYILPLLVLSKRLHSIFLLRLFNDCFASLALFAAIYAYQCRFYTIGSLLYSYGLAIKLPLLLAFPAIAVILVQSIETRRTFNNLNLMLQTQIVLGFPFWSVDAKAYFGRAFELSRQFLFKWTVNWRFIGEERFLSKGFAISLLSVNASLLGVFVLTRWLRPSGLSLLQLADTIFRPLPPEFLKRVAQNLNPQFVLTSILTSLVTGLLCARSLHYQFYAYIAWSTPFLLWKSRMPWYMIYLIWASQEWAWNVYPSTNLSSLVVVSSLAIQVISVWYGTRKEFQATKPADKPSRATHDHTE